MWRIIFVTIFGIVTFGCGTTGSPENKPTKSATAYSCEFPEFLSLPIATDKDSKKCQVNGKYYDPGSWVGELDHCNRSYCTDELDPDGEPHVISTAMACLPYYRICQYKGWLLSNCFKFVNEDQQQCTCENGTITCQSNDNKKSKPKDPSFDTDGQRGRKFQL